MGHGLGLNLTLQRLPGWGVRLGVDAAPTGDDGPQRTLSGGQVTTVVNIKGIESWPNLGSEVAASGKARDRGSGRMFGSRSGAELPTGDAERRQTPVIGKRATCEAAESRADIGVSTTETSRLHIGRHSAT